MADLGLGLRKLRKAAALLRRHDWDGAELASAGAWSWEGPAVTVERDLVASRGGVPFACRQVVTFEAAGSDVVLGSSVLDGDGAAVGRPGPVTLLARIAGPDGPTVRTVEAPGSTLERDLGAAALRALRREGVAASDVIALATAEGGCVPFARGAARDARDGRRPGGDRPHGELLDLLRAADGPSRELDLAVSAWLGPVDAADLARAAAVPAWARPWHARRPDGRVDADWTSSLDAAAALARLVLPGWWWSMGDCSVSADATLGPDVAGADADLLRSDDRRFDEGFSLDVRGGRPALSMVELAVEALTAREGARASAEAG